MGFIMEKDNVHIELRTSSFYVGDATGCVELDFKALNELIELLEEAKEHRRYIGWKEKYGGNSNGRKKD